jgi:hypothetical protein
MGGPSSSVTSTAARLTPGVTGAGRGPQQAATSNAAVTANRKDAARRRMTEILSNQCAREEEPATDCRIARAPISGNSVAMKNVLVGLVGALTLAVGCGGSSAPGNTGAAGSSASGAAGSSASGAAGSSATGAAGSSPTGAAGSSATGAAGSSASGAACTNTPACGGNIVGTWKITDSCVGSGDLLEPADDCPGQTGSTANFKITGTLVYNADQTYTAITSSTGNVVIKYPNTCLTTNGITCAALSQGVMDELAMPGATFTAGSCAAAPTACVCTLAIDSASAVEKGVYTTTAAGVLTQEPTGGDIGTSSYCVTGNTFTLSPDAASTMMGQSVMETITLTRQ